MHHLPGNRRKSSAPSGLTTYSRPLTGRVVFFAWALLACVTAMADTVGARSTNKPVPIVIGVSCVQSGPSRELGVRLMQGSMAYFNRVNAGGGVHGRPIQVIVKDDGYEPEPAIQNTHELITKDRAFFLFNYVGTPTLTRVLPLLKYYDSEQIVNVAPFTGAEPQRRPPYDKFVFNIRASYRDETRALVDYLVARGHRRIGFFGQADAYGKSGETGTAEALVKHGLSIVATATYRRNQEAAATMGRQVEILRKAGADAVISVGVYGPCASFIRDARRAGWNVPIANVSFVAPTMMLDLLRSYSKAFQVDLTANLLNSVVVPGIDDSSLPLVRGYRESSALSHSDQFIGLEGWLNAVVVTEALRRAGPNASRLDFIRAMESLGGWDPGLGVPLRFSATNHLGLDKVWIVRTDQGHWVKLDASLASK
jgi:ABC-type branched-subunit amino acid transport system substrate-binding protein